MLSQHAKSVWLNAQDAEKGHWAFLWQDKESPERIALINNEVIKGEFIFQEMADHFGIHPKTDWSKLKVLDVGCGPLSLVARQSLGKSRDGVDPLKYPHWVYEDYKQKEFEVHLVPFEEFSGSSKYDVILFYNALQHFANLEDVVQKCKKLLSKNGGVYLSEYLEVPTNEAHIQFLEKDKLDALFASEGFKIKSDSVSVRLPGYVERPGGAPIDLYVAKYTL